MSAAIDCPSARTILALYADGELDADESAAFERHLEGCSACRQTLAAERALKSAIRAMPRPAMPAALSERVRAALPRAAPARAPRRRFHRLTAMAAGLALFLLGGVAGRLALPPSGGDAAHDIVAAHMRALVSERLTDVASSDRHTVKPWFNGRVEASPPVEDFAAQGYPLVGGRLDFIDGRRAAAVVYRRRQHVINLFVWPGAGGAPGTSSAQGYNLVQWSGNGMAFAAISDLNKSELEAFAALVGGKRAHP